MDASLIPKIKLNDGHSMPIIGLGTWQSSPGEVYHAVMAAIDAGYRHLDCAYVYENEPEVGRAIKESIESGKVKREDLFITTKAWLTFKTADRVRLAIRKSLSNLGLTYLDLYLVHVPVVFDQVDDTIFPLDSEGNVRGADVDLMETWSALEDCVRLGLTKSIGVSNFNSQQIERVCNESAIRPAVNQIECHPYLAQKKLIQFCAKRGVKITAYSPLASPASNYSSATEEVVKRQVLDDQTVKSLAAKYGKSAAQILIRFQIDRELSVIPKSVSRERIASNIQVFDFKLNSDEIRRLESLDCGYRSCAFHMLGIPKLNEYPFNIEF